MKILVSGSSGFTGRYFTEAAKQAGHETIALQSDLMDEKAVSAEVSAAQPNAVVHLAAISFVGHSNNAAFYAVNVIGTTNLLSAVASLQEIPCKILVASSANIYGNCDFSPINELQTPAPVNHYAASKLAMEHMVRTYCDQLPIVITRPFNYTGHGQALNFVIPKLVNHFARRAETVELGNLNVEREFNDVRLVVKMYLALLEHGEPGQIYNICSGQPYTLGHAIDTLTELTGHQIEVIVNQSFVRTNEVRRLCGDPSRISHLLNHYNFWVSPPSFRETLSWMLKETKV